MAEPLPPLPEGYTLDQELPPLPTGYTLDSEGPGESEPRTLSEETFGNLSLMKRIGATGQAAGSIAGDVLSKSYAGVKGLGNIAKQGLMGTNDIAETEEVVSKSEAEGQEFFKPDDPAEQFAKDKLTGLISEGVNTVAGIGKTVVANAVGFRGETREDFIENPISETLGDTAESMGADPIESTIAYMIPSVAEALVGQRGIKSLDNAAPGGKVFRGSAPVGDNIPSVAKLKEIAGKHYDAVDASGIRIKQDSAQAAIKRIAENENIVSGLTSGSSAALKKAQELISGGDITMKKMEQIRRLLKKAEGSGVPADKNAAVQMVREWDAYVKSLNKNHLDIPDSIKDGGIEAIREHLDQGRATWSRARKGEDIAAIIDKASVNSQGHYTGAGFEHQLRLGFRQLYNNKKKFNAYTKAEQGLIRAVATGGKVDNFFRDIGKMAPTGELGAWLTIGAFMANPLTAVIPAVGTASKYIATRKGISRAKAVDEAVRSGVPE